MKTKNGMESKIRENGNEADTGKREKLVFVGEGEWAMVFAMVIAPTQGSLVLCLPPSLVASFPPFFWLNERSSVG